MPEEPRKSPPILEALEKRLSLHENRICAGGIIMDRDRADLDYLHKFMQVRAMLLLEQLNLPGLLRHLVETQLAPREQ